jgi:hypothetical protein
MKWRLAGMYSSPEAVDLSPPSTSVNIDQMNFTYYEAGGDPFVVVGIVGSTQNMQPLIAPAVDAAVPTTIESLVTQ